MRASDGSQSLFWASKEEQRSHLYCLQTNFRKSDTHAAFHLKLCFIKLHAGGKLFPANIKPGKGL
ncbi:hypothetical protein KSX_54170 [Ktedonospora formicarum]|uniref:Uncharacterized protein n=1 Tax=Ktedonospora formicarum TaxID=2778364 RepID=A0A8J3I8C0_9CHLR|nr:hypothetical protein KSX_54170 [Ktedonospora formicarum]